MSYLPCDTARMNLDKHQFNEAVYRGLRLFAELKNDYPELRLHPVFSRFGSGSGQCELTSDLRKIVLEFPEMLAESDGQGNTKRFRDLLFEIKRMDKSGEQEPLSRLREEVDRIERRLLEPDLKLYCGDVNIEFRCGALKYETLRRLQQDNRLPADLNTVSNVRVIAGSLEYLSRQARQQK